MKKIQSVWLKFCCFLTGYNFYILSNCSEVSIRKVKKYAAALFIVTTVWAFVGYCFCSRYIKLDLIGSITGSIVAVFIIIQIERQILLADKSNKYLKGTRIGLALLMSVIGSLIIDQIIFKDDIEKAKMSENQKQVSRLMPEKTKEINDQISQINNALMVKEQERKELLDDINKNPTQQVVEITSSQVPVINTITDSSKRSTTETVLKHTTSKTIRSVPNQKIAQLEPIDRQIAELNKQRTTKENALLNIKSVLENDIDQKIGFLDELTVMISILKESIVASGVYFIWFAFLLFLELLILIGKSNDIESDYDKIIQKQMSIHLRKVELL